MINIESLTFRYEDREESALDDITLNIEWDPVPKGSDEVPKGKVTGYTLNDSDLLFFMQRGQRQLETGDTIEFLFDFYSKDGELLRTEPYGDKMQIVTEDIISVEDKPFGADDVVEYYGILTDVYQREFMTEVIKPADFAR